MKKNQTSPPMTIAPPTAPAMMMIIVEDPGDDAEDDGEPFAAVGAAVGAFVNTTGCSTLPMLLAVGTDTVAVVSPFVDSTVLAVAMAVAREVGVTSSAFASAFAAWAAATVASYATVTPALRLFAVAVDETMQPGRYAPAVVSYISSATA